MRTLGTCLPGLAAAMLIVPASVFAQNNTAATAANIVVGQSPISTVTDAANTSRWYRFSVTPGRSYCVETWAPTNNPTDLRTDTIIIVFRINGTTRVVSNDNFGGIEPGTGISFFGPSRACWIAETADGTELLVQAQISGVGLNIPFQVRVSDTSLNCPWWFTDAASAFEGFVQLRNNSNTAVWVQTTAYNATGAVQGAPATILLGPNDSHAYALSAPPFGAASGSGNVQVSYGRDPAVCLPILTANVCATGAPGTVSANLTSIGFNAGVSFDVPCTTRQDFIR